MAILELSFASGEDSLSVRQFVVEEALSSLFQVSIVARSPNDDIDLESIVGKPALFRVVSGVRHALVGHRLWTGVCSAMAQVRVEPTGLSTYELTIVPALWLLTQRRNHRLFQHITIPDIVDKLLREWSIEPLWRIRRDRYPRLELRAQYGESDHDFLCRLLEESGISFHFSDDVEKGSRLVLSDEPQSADARAGGPIPFHDSPEQVQAVEREFMTAVRLGHEVRPGRFTIRDFDFRRPRYGLFGGAQPAPAPEDGLEQYHYRPSAFLREENTADVRSPLHEAARAVQSEAATGTPTADDHGVARFDEGFGGALAERSLTALRGSKRRVSYRTNAIDLSPGVIFSIGAHPRRDLGADRSLLVTALRVEGSDTGEWVMSGHAHFADQPHRPAMITPKPRIYGTQSALVVGPPGQEIYTDEHGRVRVQFHWDREGRFDDRSSIWMRVSQGWAGAGYGLFTVPRVGHEVLVDFLDGDPDSPIIVGRVHNGATPPPFKLPENKTVSTWRSESSPGGGGFNEIRFEDAAGREMIFEHAQRDKNQVVRADERAAVGGSRSRVVQQSEGVSVGGQRTQVVGLNEIEAVGLTRTEAVGVTKNTVVGGDETHLVGSKFSVTMGRGMASRFAKELGRALSGPLGANLNGAVTSILGRIPMTALGGLADSSVEGPLGELLGRAEGAVKQVLKLVDGYAVDPGPPPTSFEMTDRKITLSTGESSIVLDGPNIHLFADGDVLVHARGSAGVFADEEAAVSAAKKVLVQSRSDDLVVLGGPMVKLNPIEPPRDAPTLDEQLRLKDRVVPDRTCEECGAPMVIDPKDPSRLVCSAQERLAAAAAATLGAEPELGADETGAVYPDET